MWHHSAVRLRALRGIIYGKLAHLFALWALHLTRLSYEPTFQMEVKFDCTGQTIQMPYEEYTSMVLSLTSMETRTPGHGPRSLVLH